MMNSARSGDRSDCLLPLLFILAFMFSSVAEAQGPAEFPGHNNSDPVTNQFSMAPLEINSSRMRFAGSALIFQRPSLVIPSWRFGTYL